MGIGLSETREFAQHQDHARDQGGILVEDGISVRRELVRLMRFKIEEL